MSCAGSLTIIDLPSPGVQLEIDIDVPEGLPIDAMALFRSQLPPAMRLVI